MSADDRIAAARRYMARHRPTGITIDVTVRVPMNASDYAGWTPDQIKALLDGIGNVIAAQSVEGEVAAPSPGRAP